MTKTNWNEITSEEAYRLSQAEFRGMTIQALKDIKEDISQLQGYNNNTRLVSMFIAALSGIMSSIVGRQIK